MNCELGTFGMCGNDGSGGVFSFVVLPGLVATVGVDGLDVDEEDAPLLLLLLLLLLLVDVVTPNFRSRIFSSHSSQPCLGLFRLRCW